MHDGKIASNVETALSALMLFAQWVWLISWAVIPWPCDSLACKCNKNPKWFGLSHKLQMTIFVLSAGRVFTAFLLIILWNCKWEPRQTWRHINWPFCSVSANQGDLGIKVGLSAKFTFAFCMAGATFLSQFPLLFWESEGKSVHQINELFGKNIKLKHIMFHLHMLLCNNKMWLSSLLTWWRMLETK